MSIGVFALYLLIIIEKERRLTSNLFFTSSFAQNKFGAFRCFVNRAKKIVRYTTWRNLTAFVLKNKSKEKKQISLIFN